MVRRLPVFTISDISNVPAGLAELSGIRKNGYGPEKTDTRSLIYSEFSLIYSSIPLFPTDKGLIISVSRSSRSESTSASVPSGVASRLSSIPFILSSRDEFLRSFIIKGPLTSGEKSNTAASPGIVIYPPLKFTEASYHLPSLLNHSFLHGSKSCPVSILTAS